MSGGIGAGFGAGARGIGALSGRFLPEVGRLFVGSTVKVSAIGLGGLFLGGKAQQIKSLDEGDFSGVGSILGQTTVEGLSAFTGAKLGSKAFGKGLGLISTGRLTGFDPKFVSEA